MNGSDDGAVTQAEPEQPEVPGWPRQLASVRLETTGEWVRVVFDGRDGNRLFVRQADPGDGEPAPVPWHEHEGVVVMTALSHVGHHLTAEVGRTDDFLIGARIVPVRREANRVFARTLRRDEQDNGDRVHVRPGDQVTFEEGAVVVELDTIDNAEAAAYPDARYVPLTPALWAWFLFGERDPVKVRYVLAAARRLDAASTLFEEVERRISELRQDGQAGPVIRRSFFGLVSAVEAAVVSLGRVCDMVVRASSLIGATTTVPPTIVTKQVDLNEIRNAYEHIEDRALGQVRQKPHPDALTIFDYEAMLRHGHVTYAEHTLDVEENFPKLIAEAREFLKDVASAS
jgi:hypothetical protein